MESRDRPHGGLAIVIGMVAATFTAAGAYALVALFALTSSELTFETHIEHKVEVRRNGDRVQVGIRVEQPTASDASGGSILAFSWQADGTQASISHESTDRPDRTGGVLEFEMDRNGLRSVRGRTVHSK